jgi:predicted patatin/cPLA2 family phospholipase
MITHIYFSGGGLKGIAYLGVLRYLYIEKKVINIKNVAGTSIGAWFATVLALKIPVEFLEEEIKNLIDCFRQTMSINKNNLTNLFINNGVLSNKFLMIPIVKYLQSTFHQEDMNFIDFVKKTGVNLYINAVNINTQKMKVFSIESTPNVSVLQAIQASMAIPFMFEPVLIDGEYYIDSIADYTEVFKDVEHNTLLNILLPQSIHSNGIEYPKDSTIIFADFLFRVSDIMISRILANKEYDANNFHTFIIGNLSYETNIKFKITEKDVFVDITKEDVDSMILKAFIDTTNYMQKRYKEIENIHS